MYAFNFQPPYFYQFRDMLNTVTSFDAYAVRIDLPVSYAENKFKGYVTNFLHTCHFVLTVTIFNRPDR